MREVEIKFRITDIYAVAQEFSSNDATPNGIITQHDDIYLGPWVSFANLKGQNVLRIRKETTSDLSNTIYTFNLKSYKKNKLDRVEHEMHINDPFVLENIIIQLGYLKKLSIHKTRIQIKDAEYNICLDRVEGLGDFIEVEVISQDDTDYDLLRLSMINYLRSKKITVLDEIDKPYDTLLTEIQGV